MKKKIIVILILILAALATWSFWDSAHDASKLPDAGSQQQGRTLENLPAYEGEPSVPVNEGRPAFAEGEGKTEFFEKFSDMDDLGRCGPALACLDAAHMPQGERGSIGMVKPSGWQISKYDFIDNGGYLFNRCHLIGWQLSGENEEVRNLITGTRYMNVEGMLPYENRVAAYLRSSGNHVLYRVSPVYREDELVARGVQIEAESVEDGGQGLSFNVYCFNVQPGVEIDYRTGENRLAEESRSMPAQEESQSTSAREEAQEEARDYVLNTSSHRFHYPDCRGVADMKEKNKQEVHENREELIRQGYQPCGMCMP